MVLLIIASGIAGSLSGRFFRGYAVVPATILIMVPAGYLGHEQGFATGVTAFIVSAMVMQVFYFAIVVTHMLIESLSVIDRVQSEASPQLPEIMNSRSAKSSAAKAGECCGFRRIAVRRNFFKFHLLDTCS